jgi:preprotein translocase subunit SecG
MWDVLLMTALMIVGAVMMFIILLQRGRGGGLAGAFGGLGGQSAFGTKAGDVFTKITVGLAAVWVLLAGLSGFALRAGSEQLYDNPDDVPAIEAEADEPPLAVDDTPLTTEDPAVDSATPAIVEDEGEPMNGAEDGDAKAETEASISSPSESDVDAGEAKTEAASEAAEEKAEATEEPEPAEKP